MPEPSDTSTGIMTSPVSRRSFMKWGAAVGGTAAAVGAAAHYGLLPLTPAAAAPRSTTAGPATVWSSCNVNCGSRCPLILTVSDGRITRVSPEPTGDDEIGSQQIRPCVRGRAIRQRIYNPDRLKYPMKRIGTRGEGTFERISWDQAYREIAQRLRSTIDQYGNEAVYLQYASGVIGGTMQACYGPGSFIARLMSQLGGYLNFYGTYSTAQISAAYPYFYGSSIPGNSFDDAANSQLLVLWGNNPHETRMSGGGETFVTQTIKRQAHTRVVTIDPRYTDTSVTIADEWVPIRPNTDAALVAGMAHVMISEALQDQVFLDRYCIGFDEDHLPAGAASGSSYRSYVLGDGPDGTPKTPDWAAAITGVPTATIVRLAREIAQAKPCMITQGWGPQRNVSGDASARAIFTMAAMTGNVGISGGGTGGREGYYTLPLVGLPVVPNPVKTSISCFTWTDAISRGAEMTAVADGVRGKDKLDVPIKFIWNHAGNTLINQHSDTRRTAKILADDSLCETIVVIDNHLTPSAKFADYLLPDVSGAERMDLINGESASTMGYAIFGDQAIDPLWECQTIYEMCTGIARELGIADEFTEGKSYEDWLRGSVAASQKRVPGLPDFDQLRAQGIFKQKGPSTIPLADFRADPAAHPLKTPSGKIEIYSAALQTVADTWQLPDGDRITALPEYIAGLEGPEDPLREKYPLQCIGHHYKARTHSSYANSPWLREAHPQEVWINPVDASPRDIAHGDQVLVFNDRGTVRIPARVTERIAPGVVSIPQGAWYSPDADGVDIGGCINTLTTQHPTPLAKGNGQHTNLVDIKKA